MVLTIDKGQKPDIGKDNKGQDAFHVDMGSGLPVGIVGRCTSETDCHDLVFLPNVTKFSVGNVKFHTDPSGTNQGIPPSILQHITFQNDRDTETTYSFSITVTETNSSTFTQISAMTFGVEISIEAGLFEIAKVSTGFSWSLEKTSTHSKESSTQVGLIWGLQGKLVPHKKVIGTALCQRGQMDIAYTAQVTVTLDYAPWPTFSFTERGTFKNVLFVDAQASVSDPKDAAALKNDVDW